MEAIVGSLASFAVLEASFFSAKDFDPKVFFFVWPVQLLTCCFTSGVTVTFRFCEIVVWKVPVSRHVMSCSSSGTSWL